MNESYNKTNYFQKIEMIPERVYYHYTSIHALYSIVQNKCFWLTSLKSSNDRKELYYRPEQFICDVANLCEQEMSENTKKWFEYAVKLMNDNRDEFLKMCKQKSEPYALCLSEKKDSLTHWDRYACNCTGVSIGFNVSALDVYFRRMDAEVFCGGLFTTDHVLYKAENIEERLKSGIISSINRMFELNEKIAPDRIDVEQRKRIVLMCLCLTYLNYTKFIKNPAFVDEDEVRVYYDATSVDSSLRLIRGMKCDLDEDLVNGIEESFIRAIEELRINKESFSVMRTGIRSYRELCLKEIWGSGTIPEIVLGPMCVQNRNELKRFLRANGLEGTRVTISKVPIR